MRRCRPFEDVCLEHSMPPVTTRVCEENCQHENADHRGPTERFGVNSYADVEHLNCLDCGAWLSIGPSNDEPREVQIEIRAAEFVACRETCASDLSAPCACFEADKALRPAADENAARKLARLA